MDIPIAHSNRDSATRFALVQVNTRQRSYPCGSQFNHRPQSQRGTDLVVGSLVLAFWVPFSFRRSDGIHFVSTVRTELRILQFSVET